MKKSHKKCIALLSIGSCLVLAYIKISTYTNQAFSIIPSERNLKPAASEDKNVPEESEENEDRPVMHTFFEKAKYTGMSEDDDKHALESWSKAWQDVGWDTKILVLDDAKKHDKYQEYYELLEEDDIHDKYNKMCFVRWLAMAANGGGWMSDYDVYPIPTAPMLKTIGTDLPAKGKLTVYEYTRDGGVPSLISGSEEEWDRMAIALIEKSKEKGITSDMYALIALHKEDPKTFKLVGNVLKGHVPMQVKHIKARECRLWSEMIAVHISHYAITVGKESGKLKKDTKPNARPKVAHQWVNEWVVACG